MRGYVAKKQYRAHVKTETAAGRVSLPNGGWADSKTGDVGEKAYDFSRCGAAGFNAKTQTGRTWRRGGKRGRMKTMQERKVERGNMNLLCTHLRGAVQGGTINEKSVMFYAQQTFDTFAEGENVFCSDCCGRME